MAEPPKPGPSPFWLFRAGGATSVLDCSGARLFGASSEGARQSPPALPGALAVLLLALSLLAPLPLSLGVAPAFAETSESSDAAAGQRISEQAKAVQSLTSDYLAAVDEYQAALDRQAENSEAIRAVETEIDEAEAKLSKSQVHLEAASIEMYKNGIQPGELLETVLAAPSISESATLYDDYMRLEAHRRQQCEDARLECEQLRGGLASLEAQRDQLFAEVVAMRQEVADAKAALRRIVHLDGDKFHQTQGNGVNCGATAFIVGVNTLLGENRFTDNVGVWASKAFGRDSTISLVEKGNAWLRDNGLDGLIDFQYVKGDIHESADLRAELEKGNIVVISSGSGSEWQRVDAAESKKGLYPGGHWICFYGYSEGIFYANDSAVSAKRGAGCPYTEKQMQQWLDGRSYHVACVLSKVVESGDEEGKATNNDEP